MKFALWTAWYTFGLCFVLWYIFLSPIQDSFKVTVAWMLVFMIPLAWVVELIEFRRGR